MFSIDREFGTYGLKSKETTFKFGYILRDKVCSGLVAYLFVFYNCFSLGIYFGCMLGKQRSAADQILRDLQNNPDMWLQVVHVLQNTKNLNTKFFALQVSCICVFIVYSSLMS